MVNWRLAFQSHSIHLLHLKCLHMASPLFSLRREQYPWKTQWLQPIWYFWVQTTRKMQTLHCPYRVVLALRFDSLTSLLAITSTVFASLAMPGPLRYHT